MKATIDMDVTLYLPGVIPLPLDDALFTFLPTQDQIGHAATLLECLPSLVDVLASGPDYVIYTVFDSDGEINEPAMWVSWNLTGILFTTQDEDLTLRGPVLVVAA